VAPNPDKAATFHRLGFRPDLPLTDPVNARVVAAEDFTGTTPLDFDAIELLNRFSWPMYLEVRTDWFALLNAGVIRTATGNSDSHASAVEQAGFPANLVACSPEPLDAGCVVDAVRRGALTVSNGPVVDLTLRTPTATAGPGEHIQAGRATAIVRVRAADWVPVHEVRVIVNGTVVFRERLETGGPVDHEVTVPLDLAWGAWVVAEAGWPLDERSPEPGALGFYEILAPGHVPLGFTNPVVVEAR
jgi:hypothetical protein